MSAQLTDTLIASRLGIVGSLTVQDIADTTSQNLTTGLSIFSVWAEENGNLTANNTQWSFGNGSVGAIGITMTACEIFALSLDSEVLGTSVTIDIMVNNVAVDSITFTGDQYIELGTSLNINQGDILGFRTNAVTGTFTDARVAAWCGAPLQGLKGDQGPAGNDGLDGIPNTFARVVCDATPQVNNTAYTTINLNNTPTLNTAGITIVANEITVQPGSYEVKAIFSITSTTARPNQEVRMLIGGVEYGSEFGEGYIRNSGGHNEAKVTYTDIFTVGTASNISFQSRAIATAGTVVLDAGKSKILIHKIA